MTDKTCSKCHDNAKCSSHQCESAAPQTCGCTSECSCQETMAKQTDSACDKGCADHVCNDECGCELSEAAKASLARDSEKK